MSISKSRDWSREDVMKLIGLYECNPCLWECRNNNYKNRIIKSEVCATIAGELSATVDEINRKLHNLRSQWHSEIKKLKIKKSGSGAEEVYKSNWWCFDALKFLDVGNASTSDALENSSTLPTVEHEVSGEIPQNGVLRPHRASKKRKGDHILRRCTKILSESNDGDQVFGDYVASVLRNFNNPESKKKLRKIVQRAIVDIQDEEDASTSSTVSFSSDSSPPTLETTVLYQL